MIDQPAKATILHVGKCYQEDDGGWVVKNWGMDCKGLGIPFFAGDKFCGWTLEELAEIAAKAEKQ